MGVWIYLVTSNRAVERTKELLGLIHTDVCGPFRNVSREDTEEHELEDLNEPPNYKAALSDPKSDKWLDAMNTKMQSMKDNQVWCLVELHKSYNILLAIVAFYDYEIWKIDVKTTFLNGYLSDDEIKKVSFIQNPDEPCVYLKASGSNVVFLVLYFDDILIMGNNVKMLQDVKSWLCKCFSMKDLREAAYILGIKITRDRSEQLIALSQIAYFDKILKKFKMENSKCGGVPMQEKPNYRKSQGAKTPSESAEQSTIAMSSTEAEYIVATEASMQAVWMRKFIDGLRNVMPSNKIPMEMICDNAPTIAVANDPRIMKGAKHYQRKYHYIREVIQDSEIVLKKVHTDDNLADPFTKPMQYSKHFEHAMAIGFCPASSLM
nr:hypothetical protein [Tanacetum cinerariifolium]